MYEMLLEFLGFVLLALTFLLLGITLLAYRRPHPPRWTRGFMVIETIAVLLTAMLSTGIALLVQFAAKFEGAMLYVAGIGSVIAAVVLFKVIWIVLGVSRKLAAHEAPEHLRAADAGGKRVA